MKTKRRVLAPVALTEDEKKLVESGALIAFALGKRHSQGMERTWHRDRVLDAAIDGLLYAARNWNPERCPWDKFVGLVCMRRAIAMRQCLELSEGRHEQAWKRLWKTWQRMLDREHGDG